MTSPYIDQENADKMHILKTNDKSSEFPWKPITILYPDSAKFQRSIARVTSSIASISIVNPITPLGTAATYNKYKNCQKKGKYLC